MLRVRPGRQQQAGRAAATGGRRRLCRCSHLLLRLLLLLLRQLLAARDACWTELIAFARQYGAAWLAQSQDEQAAEHGVFEDLIARKISFAEANRRLGTIRAAAERAGAPVDPSSYLRP